MTVTNTFAAYGLVVRDTSAGSVLYTFDPSGNVSQRFSATGTILSTDLYDSFGLRQSTSSASDGFGFGAQSGYYTDVETGLILCDHRYYDPQTARWLTRDPVGYEGGINLYEYCKNDPVDLTDADGDAPGPPSPNPGPPVPPAPYPNPPPMPPPLPPNSPVTVTPSPTAPIIILHLPPINAGPITFNPLVQLPTGSNGKGVRWVAQQPFRSPLDARLN